MAAKVMIVAVPTVLGIASIRVYNVSEAPADGLVTREKLNIYTPLPQSSQAQFVPEKPGVIQSGLTTAREGVLPFVLAVKGAYLSVKTGSVNLYHAGEDVYYYLKDPPPEFLPRFATINMAGLLGMFLARRGSFFKRVALPLGLMSAGASVCYPAQTVCALKVSGKKVYAAGQWSSAALSSLFASKSQEPVAKDIAASQPQVATVPNPETEVVEEASETKSSTDSAQSSRFSETEVESAESLPASDEPIVSVVTEEVSSVTLAEKSPNQTLTETNTDPLAESVSAETETIRTSEEKPVSGEEPLETKPEAEDVLSDVSPVEPTPSITSETPEPAPSESTPAETAPAETAPAETAPAESAPAESAPAETAPAETAPSESAPSGSAPSESAPSESATSESAPCSEEPSAPKALEEPTVPVVESSELEPAPRPELADPPQVTSSVEETPTMTPSPPPPPQQPAAENSKGGTGFKADPALMDFGQSNPEDEDLYSTRS